MITSRDVALRAGVSQSTVSYVMSGKRPISEKTRRRVEAAIEELTYHPNAGARALASQRTQVVALVAPLDGTLDAVGLLPFLETITSAARGRDHDVLLVTADEGPSALTRLAGRRQCDAIVVMEVEARDERVAAAATLGIPVILIGVPDDPAGVACVDLDFELAGAMSVRALAEAGHRSALVVGHCAAVLDRDLNYVRRFARGVEAAATATGLDVELVSPVEASSEGVAPVVERLAGARGRGRPLEAPGVVVPHTDALAPLLRAMALRGVVPGRDASVVGLCTDAAAAALVPAVTNISLEPRDVSRRAMETLFELLDPPPASRAGGAPPPGGGRGVELVAPRLTRRDTGP